MSDNLPKLQLEDLKVGMHVHFEQICDIKDIIIALRNAEGYPWNVQGDIAFLVHENTERPDGISEFESFYFVYNGSSEDEGEYFDG